MVGITILILVALTGLIVVLVMQDATSYSATAKLSSVLDTTALICALLIVGALTVPRLLYPGGFSPVMSRVRALSWSVVALFCLWKAFGNRPRKS